MTEGTRQRVRAGGRANTRAAPRLPWALAALSVALFAASVLLWALARSAPVPASWDANLGVGSVLGSVFFLAFPLVGALIASRRPRNPVGWLLLVDGLLWMITGVLDYYIVYGVAQPGSVPYPVGMAGINNWLWVPAVGLPATYLFLLFPDGRLPSRRWRPVAWLSGAVLVLASVGVMLSPGPLDAVGRTPPNPLGLGAHPWVETATYTILPLLPLCMLVSALGLVLRYRRSQGEERQQIKWIAFAASVVGLSYHVAMVTSLVFPSGAWYSACSPLWMDLIVTVALLSFTFVPIAVGLAVLRYRLYDIDLIINRTLVYGALTAALTLAYVLAVTVLQALLRPFAGQSPLAVAGSTLAVAALFRPARARFQSFIDRRVYRRKYDAGRTLVAFSARLRDEVDLDALNAELIALVGNVMQPSHVSLWLRGDQALKTD